MDTARLLKTDSLAPEKKEPKPKGITIKDVFVMDKKNTKPKKMVTGKKNKINKK